MKRLHRQILTLGVCFAAAMAGRVYFDRTAELIEKTETDEGGYEVLPAPEGESPGALSLPADAGHAASVEVDLPAGDKTAIAVEAELPKSGAAVEVGGAVKDEPTKVAKRPDGEN